MENKLVQFTRDDFVLENMPIKAMTQLLNDNTNILQKRTAFKVL